MHPAGASRCRSPASRSPRPSRSSGAPRRPAGTTCGRGDTNGPDGFTPLALAAAWTDADAARHGRRLGVHARARRCSPSTPRRWPTRRAAASCSGSAPRRDVIVERWNGVPFEQAAHARARDGRGAAPRAGRRARAGRLQARDPARGARADLRRRAARPDARARRAGRRRHVRELPARSRRSSTSSRRSRRRAGHDVVCRFFCIPQPAEEGLGLARFLFAGYATVPVYEAFFRGLGWGAALDPMVDAWRARRPQAGGRARAGGAAARDLRVRRGRRRCASGWARTPRAGSRRSA